MASPSLGTGWEELFWAVFRRTANPVGLLDEQRRFVDVNDAAVPVFGRSRGELMGLAVVDLIKDEEREESTRDWREFLAKGGDHSGTRTILRPDGSEVEIEFAARMTTIAGARRAVYVLLRHSEDTPSPGTSAPAQLTDRERQIVAYIAMGYDTKQMAERLYLSPETVRTHVRNAMGRLQVHTRAQLVSVALTSEMLSDLLHMEEPSR